VLSTVNMVVQRRDSPLWLRELDDDDDDSQFPFLAFSAFPPSPETMRNASRWCMA